MISVWWVHSHSELLKLLNHSRELIPVVQARWMTVKVLECFYSDLGQLLLFCSFTFSNFIAHKCWAVRDLTPKRYMLGISGHWKICLKRTRLTFESYSEFCYSWKDLISKCYARIVKCDRRLVADPLIYFSRRVWNLSLYVCIYLHHSFWF